MKPVVHKGTSVGDLTKFVAGLRDRDISVSITFDDGFDWSDTADFKVYMNIEPPEVLARMKEYYNEWEPEVYKPTATQMLLDNHTFYDLILTWNEEVLRKCPNAVLFPQALCTWIDKCYQPFCDE